MMRRLLTSLAAVAMVTLPVRAEVRIARDVEGHPRLEVRPTPSGIWAPRGLPTPAVINPAGDQWGDGYPASAFNGDLMLGAWVRAASSELVLLRAQDEHATGQTSMPASDASGTPIVVPVGDNWFIAWTVLAAEPSVSVAVVTSATDETAVDAVPGRLVAVLPVGNAVHVLSLRASSGELYVATFLGMHLPEPFPISTSRTIVDLRLPMHVPTPVPVPIHGQAGMHLPHPIPIPIPTTTAWAPCIEVRADDALVAWTARDHQVGSIVLDELGVVDAARFARGPSGSCTAVLNAASRQ